MLSADSKSKLFAFTCHFALLLALFGAHFAPASDFQFFNLTPEVVTDPRCGEKVAPPKASAPKVRLKDQSAVIITAWNFENVLELRGKRKFSRLDPRTHTYIYDPVPDQYRILEDWKFAAKQRKILNNSRYLGLAQEQLPHFIIGTEIESLEAANALWNSEALMGKYATYQVRGNDPRNINIAFAVRADLDVKVEFESYRQAEWIDPIERGRARIFSRDLPVLIVRDGQANKVLLVLVGNHAKSQRDRPGDPMSNTLRSAQYQAARLIIDQLHQRFGDNVPLIIAGDFNTDIRTSEQVRPVLSVLRDSLELVNAEIRITHTYYPREGGVVASQLDGILLASFLQPHLLKAMVLPEFDHVTGAPLPMIPPSYNVRNNQYPSDHRATSVVFSPEAFR